MLVPISRHWNLIHPRIKEHLYQSYFIKGHQSHRNYLESIGRIWHDNSLICLEESSVYTETKAKSLNTIDKLIGSLEYEINRDSIQRLGPGIEMYFNLCLLTLLMHQALDTQALRNYFRSQTAYDAPNRAIVWFPVTASNETYHKRRRGLCIHNLKSFTEDLNGTEVAELRIKILDQLNSIGATNENMLWEIMLAPFS